jgi:orotate phosphoribosyltransferase
MPLQTLLGAVGSQEAVRALFAANAVGFARPNAILFKHGVLSPGAYINNRVLPSHREAWDAVLDPLYRHARGLRGNYDGIASVATGGVPHGVALARLLKVPHFSVKKQEKGHGVSGLIDGDTSLLNGMKILMVEDMSSTFESTLKAMRPLESVGALVVHTLLLNTWNLPDFRRNVQHHSVFALCDGLAILNEAVHLGKIDAEHEDIVRHWLEHPEDESWSKTGGWVLPKAASE